MRRNYSTVKNEKSQLNGRFSSDFNDFLQGPKLRLKSHTKVT